MPTISGVENINWFEVISSVTYWIGIILLVCLILGIIVWLAYITTFNIKATVIPMYGSGKDGIFSFSKPLKNKLRWAANRTVWRPLWPLLNKKEIEPFDSEYMYPGNTIVAFQLNDQWIPGRINITQTEQELRAEINPVPYYIRNWQSLQHKKNAIEFSKQGFWEQNKQLFITVLVVMICCLLCGVTVYYTYQFATGGMSVGQNLADAINNLNIIQGAAPK